MPVLDCGASILLAIDFQARLMPVIEDAEDVLTNARRLLDIADRLGIPRLFTEQNPAGLGATVGDLAPREGEVFHKMTFDASRAEGLLENLTANNALIVMGCEAHVCVLQTVLGLLSGKREVYIVRDAIGSRRLESKEAALRRMERHGAEIVTVEMVMFEWLDTCEHPQFRNIVKLIK